MLNGTRNILSLFISKMTTSWNEPQNLITIVVHQDYQPQPLCLFTASSSFFYSFNFSCCKAHDFCERNLVKPEKCGGNLRNIDQRFEYDAATDTCSEYYQYFLCIISVLSFFVVCIILPKSLASTFLTVICFVSVTLYDKDWPWEHGRKSPNNS